ncbi:MAG: YicC/YloC family endoribonuclease [Bacillota bacterium]|nr:YicC/YloC family endoribonuclease [Bacillota bacterium]
MSGFGSNRCEREGYEIAVEIKTVNHRYFDFNVRMPKNLAKFEDDIKKCIQKRISRGRVDVFINFANRHPGAKNVILDEVLLDAYLTRLHMMARRRKLKNDISVMQLARLPEIIAVEEEHEDENFLRKLVIEAVDGALDGVVKMREMEGQALCGDILSRMDSVSKLADAINGRAGRVLEEYAVKLRARLSELLKDIAVDDTRLAAEAAIYADRCDITEEVIRLKSHIAQTKKLLILQEPQGRKVDFLAQEMHREVNTMGSKSLDTEIATAVIEAKAEIEKIREQAQNLE